MAIGEDNPQQPGMAQEQRVRAQLRGEGYIEPFGTDDNEIARALRITGKRADVVMQHPNSGRWLVAESEGGNMDAAVVQLKNTTQGLQQRGVAFDDIDVRLYTNEVQYERLCDPDEGVGGYLVNDDGYLGWMQETDNGTNTWQYATANGKWILVHRAP